MSAEKCGEICNRSLAKKPDRQRNSEAINNNLKDPLGSSFLWVARDFDKQYKSKRNKQNKIYDYYLEFL